MADLKSASRLVKALFWSAIGWWVKDCGYGGSMGVRADTDDVAGLGRLGVLAIQTWLTPKSRISTVSAVALLRREDVLRLESSWIGCSARAAPQSSCGRCSGIPNPNADQLPEHSRHLPRYGRALARVIHAR
jgi:hypothetical protein